MSLKNGLTIIFKHKLVIVGTFVTIVAAATIFTLYQEPTFEAKASLLVKMFREDPSRPGMGRDESMVPRIVSQDEVVNAEIQILTGRELAENVIRTLKLEVIYPGLAGGTGTKADAMEQAVRTFGGSLQVVGVRKSNVIAISFKHNDPNIAAKAVNLLIEAFKEKHLALHSDPQSSFIGNQLASFQAKLKDSERALQEYQQLTKVFSIEEQRSLLLRQRTELDTAYKSAIANVRENKKKIDSLKVQLEYISNNKDRYTQTERDRIIIEAKSKLLELQLKEQELKAKYTENNKLLADTRRELEIVSKFLKDQEESILGKVKTANPVYQSMETDLFRAEADFKSQAAKADALMAQLNQLDHEIAALDKTETKIQELKRAVAINEKNYLAYVERHEDAQVSDVMNRLKLSNISVIEEAVSPIKPIKPNKVLNILIGILAGTTTGLAYAYLKEMLAATFADAESVEKFLEVPVLVTVPFKKE